MLSPVSGFPNYIINDNGVIISCNTNEEMKQQINKDGYKCIGLINKKEKKFLVHRLVYQHFGKDWNPELTVDHIDRDINNNNISNLRMATRQQQSFNQVRKSKLGVRGVCKIGTKYRVIITIDKKPLYLGMFKTIEEAKEVHDTKAKELHGEFYRVG
jgi:hypothetical protein